MAFRTSTAGTGIYKGSFFPQTIKIWNSIQESVIFSAEIKGDCIDKFTSLVRARTNFPNYMPW